MLSNYTTTSLHFQRDKAGRILADRRRYLQTAYRAFEDNPTGSAGYLQTCIAGYQEAREAYDEIDRQIRRMTGQS